MGVYSDHFLPRAIDFVLGARPYSELRASRLSGVTGRVLEIGFGSGLNLPHLASMEGIRELLAVDPALVGRKLARGRIAECPFPVSFVGLDGTKLAVESESIDSVVSTFTLCTIADPGAALAEVRRVLRPDGRFHFIEHGHASDPGVARWQERLNPLQRRLAGGCQLNRPIDELLHAAGFVPDTIDMFYAVGPRWIAFTYAGSAPRPAAP